MVEGPRGLKLDELDELCALVGKVFNWSMRENFPTLFCEENLDNIRIIKDNGKIVSHIGIVVRDMIINGCRISVGNVGAVCTDENYRKRGYAWAILDDAIEKLRADGVDMLLVSGYRTLYKHHGCTHVGQVARYFVTPELNLPETNVKVSPYVSDNDLPEWANLHINEPIRFHRPYDDFYKLTTGGIVNRKDRSLFSIRNGDRISAYAVLDYHRSDKDDSISLNEYAGSRKAILESIRIWHEQFNVSNIIVPVPVYDVEFSKMLESIGANANYGNTGGTITIINFTQLCKKMVPLFEEIIGRSTAQNLTFKEHEGTYIIGLNGDECIFSDAHDIARLIFGNPPSFDENDKVQIQGKLCCILNSIFPIPRPEYGLSYI